MRFMRDNRGQAVIVELALVLPLLLVFIFAIIDYGRAMYFQNCLIHAARTGARAAVVKRGLMTESLDALSSDTSSEVASAVKNALVGVDAQTVKYQLMVMQGGTGTTVTGPATRANYVRVRLTHPYQMITPFRGMLKLLDSTTNESAIPTIVGEAVMRYE